MKGSSLFASLSANNSNLFANKEGSDDEGEDEGEEVFQKSNSPDAFKPTESKPANSDFNRIYIKQIENFFVYSKDDNKYLAKGKGFISIEQHKEKEKSYFIVFRNSMGTILFNGVINSNLKLSEKTKKDYKNILSFGAFEVGKDGKSILKLCKVPVS